jgi:glycosyltransferase involved in cell wall biosynthesis
MKQRVLYVLHNHPTIRPGGSEAYAVELYEAARDTEHLDPLLVARIGQSGASEPVPHPGAPFSTIGSDPGQHYVYTDRDAYDFVMESYRDKSLYTVYFADFLRTHKPDIVHFQHTHFIGFDLVTLVRRMLPDTPIVYTLHEFLPICHREGQLLRTKGNELCLEASPRRCSECFPQWGPQYFYLRERFIKSHLAQVDRFLCPSRFLLERYADWGIPREKLLFEDYGRNPQVSVESPAEGRPRTRLGFFGQISRYKGIDVLLDAMRILEETAPDVHLVIYGANLDVLPPEEREIIVNALEASGTNVGFGGAYGPGDVPELMSRVDWVVVPSRWWENSPLVIQEAFMHKRPVICSDIGGMAEKVAHDVSGLHFTVGDPQSLAETIRVAVSAPGLWERLRDGISPVYGMDEHLAHLTALYDELSHARSRHGHELTQQPLEAIG